MTHVAEIVLDRPDAHNALCTAMADELAEDRAVMLAAAAAKAFCVGADPKERSRVGADESEWLGPVDRRTAAGEHRGTARELARRIARNSPVGVRAAMRLGHGVDPPAGLELEDAARRAIAFSAVRAFNEKRAPRWPG